MIHSFQAQVNPYRCRPIVLQMYIFETCLRKTDKEPLKWKKLMFTRLNAVVDH